MLARSTEQSQDSESMSFNQASLMWALLLVQGSRRLWEETKFSKNKSSSNMPLSHYLLGIFFYTGVGIGIWIEGSGRLFDGL